MAEAQKIAVRPRTVLGKKVGRLRREGRLPGVVYGLHAESLPVDTDQHDFELGYRRWGQTTLMSLEGLDGGEVAALISNVARDPRTGKMIHVDFARVSLTEKTHAEVPLHFTGESPAVKAGDAVLIHALDHVRIEAFPQDIPHRIDVDLSPLQQLDDAIFVRDLIVDTQTVEILNDPEELVVKAAAVKVEAEPTPATAAAEGEAAEAAEGEESEAAAAKPAAPGAKPAAAGAKPAAPAAKAAPEKKG
ncbi:MAG TPA: 50S ribosomal protein L25 [Candidatus Limnocylindria bacterium]|nr:50S ribosomal protein L25 [Candidatus Limnocylindria bacterium]